MNERIRELAVQADNYAYKMNTEQDSYGRSANPRKFQQDRDAKFAESLIRKCADIADLADENKCEWIGGNILTHFGVEE